MTGLRKNLPTLKSAPQTKAAQESKDISIPLKDKELLEQIQRDMIQRTLLFVNVTRVIPGGGDVKEFCPNMSRYGWVLRSTVKLLS